jgi:putative transposase
VAAFIVSRRAGHGIPQAVSCRALGVSQARFCKWSRGKVLPRAARRRRLRAGVARLFGLHAGKYGSPRITGDLRDAGWKVSESTVAGLMRGQGLAARPKRRRRRAPPGGAGAAGGHRTW